MISSSDPTPQAHNFMSQIILPISDSRESSHVIIHLTILYSLSLQLCILLSLAIMLAAAPPPLLLLTKRWRKAANKNDMATNPRYWWTRFNVVKWTGLSICPSMVEITAGWIKYAQYDRRLTTTKEGWERILRIKPPQPRKSTRDMRLTPMVHAGHDIDR